MIYEIFLSMVTTQFKGTIGLEESVDLAVCRWIIFYFLGVGDLKLV